MLSKSLPAESALQKLPYTNYDYKYVSQILAMYTDIIPNKFHNYTTSNVLLTSKFRLPSAAFVRNRMFRGHCSLDGVASMPSRLSHT